METEGFIIDVSNNNNNNDCNDETLKTVPDKERRTRKKRVNKHDEQAPVPCKKRTYIKRCHICDQLLSVIKMADVNFFTSRNA